MQGLAQIFDNNVKTVKDNSNLKQIWTTRTGNGFSTYLEKFSSRDL